MTDLSSGDVNNVAVVEKAVDSRISPWKWSLGLGCYFPISQLLSILGSQNPGFPSYVWIIFLAQAVGGALLGALAAYAARNIVKAIKC
jgi:hypothetical protein